MTIKHDWIGFDLDGQRIRPIALLDVYKNREKVKIELEQSDELAQMSTDDDEQRTIASDVTEQSELNEPIDDPVKVNNGNIDNEWRF